ncbi:MAG: glycosyltransferase family 4 protein [Sulfuricaulis sp.]|uniref:glycosyltransferase family 4 protein n=1 Tax=Sulfuricaulis sp. TaxID=2003553 RepID=UPI0034A246B0
MKVLFFANTDWYLYNFRLLLATALRANGFEVVFVSPPGSYSQRLVEAGFRWISLPMKRHGLNPLMELINLIRLIRVYRREQPTLVHHFTIKCVLYGSIAARATGVRAVINAITGLGFVFIDEGRKARILRWLVRPVYRIVLRNTHVIFQNTDDRQKYAEENLLSGDKGRLIRGSGIDVSQFKPSPQDKTGPKRVLFVGRLLRAKGVAEYVEAASLVRKAIPNVLFQIAGDKDTENPDKIEDNFMLAWNQAKNVEFLGHRDEMYNLLNQVDLVVLPSYREGVSRALIEAAACGLPLVASDVPGCREIVKHGVNGVLVPIKNSHALADAIMMLLRDDQLRDRMGKISRKIACEEFSDKRVISETLDVYRLAGLPVEAGTMRADHNVGEPRVLP